MDVLIVPTGTANTASVAAWLRRAGASPRITDDAAEIASAPAVILPGVGAFAAAMHELTSRSLTQPLRARVADGRATLAICLGLQLLFDASDESPGVRGLGIIPDRIRKLPDNVRVPHMGWNRLTPHDPPADDRVVTEGDAYFANSYAAATPPESWRSTITTHGVPFIAAIERGPVVACQFHPELSGRYGRSLLDRWLRLARAASSEPLAC